MFYSMVIELTLGRKRLSSSQTSSVTPVQVTQAEDKTSGELDLRQRIREGEAWRRRRRHSLHGRWW